MATGNRTSGSRRLVKQSACMALLLAVMLAAGCAPLSKSRSWVSVDRSTVGSERHRVVSASSSGSLASIVNHTIQRGHYAEGEAALERYLKQHPDDPAARAMLRQLTVTPDTMLGRESRDYTVQAGDSYSSLAARYLGDASLFVVLARYNGSTNPADLRVGQTVRLPISKRHPALSDRAAIIEAVPPRESAPVPSNAAAPSPVPKARQLQAQSMALLREGRKVEALKRLDQALTLDPGLKSSGSTEAPLRKQLVGRYHERAVVLYRDQRLDDAIALWDRVLAIDPSFEPAVIYRTRALELKRRLKQL